MCVKIKNPVPGPPGIEPFSRPYPHSDNEIQRLMTVRSPQTHPKKRFFPSGSHKAGLLARSCRNAFPVLEPVA